MEEAKASQSENRSQNNVLTALNRLRDEGKVEGFHVRSDYLCFFGALYAHFLL